MKKLLNILKNWLNLTNEEKEEERFWMEAQMSSMDFWNSPEDDIWDNWYYDIDKDPKYK